MISLTHALRYGICNRDSFVISLLSPKVAISSWSFCCLSWFLANSYHRKHRTFVVWRKKRYTLNYVCMCICNFLKWKFDYCIEIFFLQLHSQNICAPSLFCLQKKEQLLWTLLMQIMYIYTDSTPATKRSKMTLWTISGVMSGWVSKA